MAISVEEINEQLEAINEAIVRLTPKERDKIPTLEFADRVNTLLTLARESCPDVDPRLWPPPIGRHEGAVIMPKAHYVELHAQVLQIQRILPIRPVIGSSF